MRIAKEHVDVQMEIPGVTIRQQKGFGSVNGYGEMSGEYFTLAAGVDTTPLFIGLENDRCQCPHCDSNLTKSNKCGRSGPSICVQRVLGFLRIKCETGPKKPR